MTAKDNRYFKKKFPKKHISYEINMLLLTQLTQATECIYIYIYISSTATFDHSVGKFFVYENVKLDVNNVALGIVLLYIHSDANFSAQNSVYGFICLFT